MKITAACATLLAGIALAACGPGESPKATPAAAPTSTATPTSVDAKKEAKHDTPDTHGMPGMSELFKGDDKAGEKPPEKADAKAGEKK
jgi:hypothetical protein